MNPEQQQASPGRSPNEAAMSWVSKEGLQGSELWNERQPPTKESSRGKQIAKRYTIDLDADEEEEEQSCQAQAGHARKNICYASVGSKFLRTTRSEPTETRSGFRGRLRTISTKMRMITLNDLTLMTDLVALASKTMKSSGGSQPGSISESLYEDLRRKMQAVEFAYKAKKAKELALWSWRERFMNYLEEQTDGEAMINSIQNGDQPLPVIAQVLLAGNAQNAPPTLKDLKFWTAEEKRLERLIMRGSEYGEQDRKSVILYEYETFKATEGEQLIDTYLRYLQVINDLKKYGYKKDNCDVNDALGNKKKAVVITSDPLALVAEKTKVSKRKEKIVVSSNSEGSGTDDFSELKKITALLAKAFNRRKFYSKPTNINLRTSSTSQFAIKKQEFVKTDDKKVEKKDDEKKRDMSKVKCYNFKKKGHFAKDCKKAKVKDYNYYKTKMLLAKKDSDKKCFLLRTKLRRSPVVILIRKSMQTWSSWLKLKRFFHIQMKVLHPLKKPLLRKKIDEQEILFDKMSRQLVEMNNSVLRLQEKILEKEMKILELEGCVSNKYVEIEKYLERLNECENKLHKIRQTNQTMHMIMPSNDTLYNGQKGIGFENPSYFEKAKDLRPSLYDEKVIGLGYTPMFLIHSDKALEIKKFKRAIENKIKFAYDYGNLNASYVNEKINFSDDYFHEIINSNFEKIDSPFQ
nr:hypothetical protein [Tanacetum cinerariifolium]